MKARSFPKIYIADPLIKLTNPVMRDEIEGSKLKPDKKPRTTADIPSGRDSCRPTENDNLVLVDHGLLSSEIDLRKKAQDPTITYIITEADINAPKLNPIVAIIFLFYAQNPRRLRSHPLTPTTSLLAPGPPIIAPTALFTSPGAVFSSPNCIVAEHFAKVARSCGSSARCCAASKSALQASFVIRGEGVACADNGPSS